MSASNTNIEKQKKRHSPALIGIGAALAFGLLAFILNVYSSTEENVDLVGEDLISNDTPTEAADPMEGTATQGNE